MIRFDCTLEELAEELSWKIERIWYSQKEPPKEFRADHDYPRRSNGAAEMLKVLKEMVVEDRDRESLREIIQMHNPHTSAVGLARVELSEDDGQFHAQGLINNVVVVEGEDTELDVLYKEVTEFLRDKCEWVMISDSWSEEVCEANRRGSTEVYGWGIDSTGAEVIVKARD